MSRFGILLKKNLSLIVQNKFSYFLIFFLPLLLIVLITSLYYNQTTYVFPLGVVKDNSTLAGNYTAELEEQGFIIYEENSQDACLDALSSGQRVACVIFPQGFSLDKTQVGNIKVYYDNTKRELLPIVQNTLNSGLDSFTTQLQYQEIGKLVSFAQNEHEALKKISSHVESLSSQFANIEKQLKEAQNFGNSLNSLSSNNKEKVGTLDETQDSSRKTLDDAVDTLQGITRDLNIEIGHLQEEADNSNSSDLEDLVGEFDELAYAVNATAKTLNESLTNENSQNTISDLLETTSSINSELSQLNLRIKRAQDNNVSEVIESANQTLTSSLATLESGELITNSQVLTTPAAVLESHSIDTSKGQLNSLFPSLFTVLIVILCLLIAGNLSFRDSTNSGHLRLFLTLSPNFLFISSKIITVFIITSLQLVPILVLGAYVFLQQLPFSTFALLVAATLISSLIFISLGSIIGMVFRNQTGFFLANIFVLFLFFLASGKILPLELLPSTLHSIFTLFNPYFLTESLLRRILLGQSFLEIGTQLFMLFLWAVGLFLIAWGIEAKFLKFMYLQVRKEKTTTKKRQ